MNSERGPRNTNRMGANEITAANDWKGEVGLTSKGQAVEMQPSFEYKLATMGAQI